MASNRRRSLRKLGNYVNNIDRRVRALSKRQTVTGLADRTVGTGQLQEGAVTTDILDSTISSDISDAASDAADALAAAGAAQTTADGKNKVYRQTSQPTGGTYADGDLWFDTDDGNKIYRYSSSTSTWVGFTLGDNALASISANKITAGTIDASVITVSNLNAGNITVGTLSGIEIIADTGSVGGCAMNAEYLQTTYGYGLARFGNTGTEGGNWSGAIAHDSTTGSYSYLTGEGVAAKDSTGDGMVLHRDYIGSSSTTGTTPVQGYGFSFPFVGFGPGPTADAHAFSWNGTQVFAVVNNNAGYYLQPSSDRRGKINIEEPSDNWIDTILNDVKIWQFDRVNTQDTEDLHVYHGHIGVIADEFKEIFPQFEMSSMMRDPDGDDADFLRSVDYVSLVPALILICQRFNLRIKELEDRLNA